MLVLSAVAGCAGAGEGDDKVEGECLRSVSGVYSRRIDDGDIRKYVIPVAVRVLY